MSTAKKAGITAEFLSHVRDLGVNLWVDGNDLRYSAPKGVLTPDFRAELVRRKVEILTFLRETYTSRDPAETTHETNGAESESSKTFVKPHTPVEEVLARIWREVLGVERVGIHDNFFELGGDSVQITQIISRVRDTLRVELPLETLFQTQTVGTLATAILEDSSERLEIERIAELLIRVAQLSEEEVETMFAKETAIKLEER